MRLLSVLLGLGCLASLIRAEIFIAPAGTSPIFQKHLVAISKATGAERKSLVDHLPKHTITIQFDEKGVPEKRRNQIRQMRDEAFSAWISANRNLSFIQGEHPDLKISFTDTLPVQAGGVIPAGAVFFESFDPKEPRCEAVIAMRRGPEKVPASDADVYNEILHGVGVYFGLAPVERTASVMHRVDEEYGMTLAILPPNLTTVNEILKLSASIRQASATGANIEVGVPAIQADSKILECKPVAQGDPVRFKVAVTNIGTGPLRVEPVPDCGCIGLTGPPEIAVGKTDWVQVGIDTRNVPGSFDKSIHLYSNDPERPVIDIPIRFMVLPRFRIIREDHAPILYADDKGVQTTYYLFFPAGKPIAPVSAEIEGPKGTVSIKPWKGRLSDIEMHEDEIERNGYRLDVQIDPDILPGRMSVNLLVKTADPNWLEIRAYFQVQKGIGIFPATAYFGEIGKTPVQRTVTLSRPGKPFKVTKVTANGSFLAAHWEPSGHPDELRIVVQYLGNGAFGDWEGNVVVETDDPKDSKITIPVIGVIR